MSANCGDETAGTARQSIWFAIEHPDHGWKRFPLNRALLVSRGEVCLPEFANHVMRTALVHVLLRDRLAIGVSQIEFSTWKFDADGRVDQNEARRRILQKLNGESSAAEAGLLAAEVEAIKRCLGIAAGKL